MKKVILTATTVPDEERNDFPLELFGARNSLIADRLLYSLARSMVADFKGGLWLYRRTSNEARYAALAAPERMTITVVGNQFEREVSADAAGIILTLTAIGYLMARTPSEDGLKFLDSRYYALLDYAKTLPEREPILAAID